jgi:hypothetical protein
MKKIFLVYGLYFYLHADWNKDTSCIYNYLTMINHEFNIVKHDKTTCINNIIQHHWTQEIKSESKHEINILTAQIIILFLLLVFNPISMLKYIFLRWDRYIQFYITRYVVCIPKSVIKTMLASSHPPLHLGYETATGWHMFRHISGSSSYNKLAHCTQFPHTFFVIWHLECCCYLLWTDLMNMLTNWNITLAILSIYLDR